MDTYVGSRCDATKHGFMVLLQGQRNERMAQVAAVALADAAVAKVKMNPQTLTATCSIDDMRGGQGVCEREQRRWSLKGKEKHSD